MYWENLKDVEVPKARQVKLDGREDCILHVEHLIDLLSPNLSSLLFHLDQAWTDNRALLSIKIPHPRRVCRLPIQANVRL